MKFGFRKALLLALSFGPAGLLSAGDQSISGSASLGIFNRYIFRGYRIGRDSAVVQPALSVSCGGISVSFWGNIDIKEKATVCFVPDRPGQKSLNETDLIVNYAHDLGRLGLIAGFIYYGTKYTTETQELYAGVSYNVFGKPTLTVYRDISAFPGTYILFSASQSLPLGKRITLDLGASAAYFSGSGEYWRTYLPSAGSYVGEKYRAFHDGMAKIGLTFPLGKRLGLQAAVQYFFPLSATAGRVIQGHSYNVNGYLTSLLVFGTALNFGF